ncbi:DUF4250 domain-containing protein [Defluviitalea raffinosedens]|uniref:DUF4250 domain-containing protein n=1 Tax=Defluviitalea raffinosedens TaxID=1450156 RepID=UPI00195BD582|nr:DUF4250 domain-containing protein [Defluviitalea raffinosedens]MBM7685967.1 hypothetical protein [Defluviitalea raffinosedens]
MNSYVPLGDPYILLSWLNMKLRDECKDLDQLCERYDLSEQTICDMVGAIGYVYEKQRNRFISKDADGE